MSEGLSANDSQDLVESLCGIGVHELRVGGLTRYPIYDDKRLLLIAAGTELSPSFVQNLMSRGVTSLMVHEQDLPYVYAGHAQGTGTEIRPPMAVPPCQDSNPVTRKLDEELARPLGTTLPLQGEAFAERLQPVERTSYDAELRDEMVERQVQQVARIEDVFQGLLGGKGLDLDVLKDITEEALDDIVRDVDIFASLGLNPYGNSYPARHCLHCCMLGINIGLHLQLDKSTLKELAIGCLIHDAGMLKIKQGLSGLPRSLTRSEFLEITKHPVRVFDFVRSLEQIPRRSALIAYQIHERNDGSGYPRGRTGNQIHLLSKIAAVADYYSALVAPRPYRPAVMPARAIEHVVSEGSNGRFDPEAVRALLQTTSLYPLGSYVLLSDNRVAQTIRSNGMEFDRPVVEAWTIGQLQDPPEVVDLVACSDVHIVQAIPRLDLTLEDLKELDGEAEISRTATANQLNLAARLQAGDDRNRRRGDRRPFVKKVKVFGRQDDAGTAKWVALTAQSRNLSRGGIGLLDEHELPSDDILVAIEQSDGAPFFLESRIVHRRKVRDDLWEYGAMFVNRVIDPATLMGSGRPKTRS